MSSGLRSCVVLARLALATGSWSASVAAQSATTMKCLSHGECPGAELCVNYVCAPPPATQSPTPAPEPPPVTPTTPTLPTVAAPAPAVARTAPLVAEPLAPPSVSPPPSPPERAERASPSVPSPAPRPAAGDSRSAKNPLDEPGVVLSLERAFGLQFWNVDSTRNGADSGSTSGTSASLLWGVGSPDAAPALAYHVPRAALDYHGGIFTIGGSAGFFSGGSTETDTDGETDEGPNLTLVAVTARGGLLLPLGAKWLFWPKVGVTYFSFSESRTSSNNQERSTSVNGWGLGLDAALAYRLLPSLALAAGLSLDFPLAGAVTSEPAAPNAAEVGSRARSVGLNAGLVVIL